MRELVMNMINVSGQAAVIFMVLLVARGCFALGRVPKKYAYGLWAILFIRLLLPIQIEARWGLMPQLSSFTGALEHRADAGDVGGQGEEGLLSGWQSMPEGGLEVQPARQGNSEIAGDRGDVENSGFAAGHSEPPVGSRAEEKAGAGQLSLWAVPVGVWMAGSLLLIGYGVFSYIRLKKKLGCSLRLEGWGEGVYLADDIETPFVLGFTAPKIYLPSNMADKSIPYVVAHERIHIRRRDYLVKLGAYLITCLYWFHPLVWAGFALMSRDMEMSCDEAVLRRLGGDCREAYADSLLQLACGKHYPAAAPLAFGEGDTRGRIKHIMGYRKTVGAVAVAAVALTGILAAVLLTSPRGEADDTGQLESEAQTGSTVQPEREAQMEAGAAGDGESFQVAYRDVVSCPLPAMTGNTSLGADGAILDYVDENQVIFHGYFGLYIYSASAGKTVGAVDLRALGCGDTQGSNTCQVYVSRDGSKVYFYPLEGIEGMESSDREQVISSYVYEVESGRLRLAVWKQEGFSEKMNFPQMMGEELAESRTALVGQEERTAWEQGFFSDYGIMYEKDGETLLGYLKSASGALEDLVYVQRPAYGENPGVIKGNEGHWEAVGLFGAAGRASTVSYGQGTDCPITIDGTAYELGRAMTEYRMGEEMIEAPQGNTSVNAITGLQYVGGVWIVQGHINTGCNSYSFYDPAAGEWMCHVIASCLTWGGNGGNRELIRWEGNRESLLSTVIYALDNRIYSLENGLINPFLSLQEQEEIYGLYRYDDVITVMVRSALTQDSRVLVFSYKRSGNGGAIRVD